MECVGGPKASKFSRWRDQITTGAENLRQWQWTLARDTAPIIFSTVLLLLIYGLSPLDGLHNL